MPVRMRCWLQVATECRSQSESGAAAARAGGLAWIEGTCCWLGSAGLLGSLADAARCELKLCVGVSSAVTCVAYSRLTETICSVPARCWCCGGGID